MLEFKVIRLVQALLSKELSAVERYLSSPHVTSNQECVQLFVQICKFYPEMDSPKLTKERLFAKLYGKQPYNDGKMRKLMTQLTQAIEQYLMETELKKSEELQAKLLAQALSERNNYKLFSEVVLTRLKVLENGVGRGRDFFRESYELSEMLHFHPGSVKLTKKDEHLKRAIGDFERYFTLVMLQNEANNAVVARVVTTARLNSNYIRIILQMAENSSFTDYDSIQLFKRLAVLLQDNSEVDIDKLRITSFATFPLLSQFEQDLATNLLRNYAIPFSNKGSMEHARFVFDLYRLELERGLYANTMSVGSFINMVTIALAIDETDWVKYFLENFDNYLPPQEKENTLNYCWGIWHYRVGILNNEIEEFYDALKCFNFIPIKAGANYEFRVRSAFLRVYFELFERNKESLDELFNQIRNFERHLKGNNQYALQIRSGYINFLRYLKMLARMFKDVNIKVTTAHNFVVRLEQEDSNIHFKPWLLEKAHRLLNI